ncbi:hypothetical protein TcasGA2_TC014838 [Tribolium castaneum]|uniref:Tyr recombinase domain-containing protein n=1 Tax=Tribolium castaneum TaxID=7070 RepID=D2A4E7_TRICA|nr:hypothetical protein TcasGA2_TC014838 [Tribolium castaneum]
MDGTITNTDLKVTSLRKTPAKIADAILNAKVCNLGLVYIPGQCRATETREIGENRLEEFSVCFAQDVVAVTSDGPNVMVKFGRESPTEMIAQFLKLPNDIEYTGHSFRRSSATLLANAGADLSVLKRHGGWRSSSVAEGYIEDSLQNKIHISKKILGEQEKLVDEDDSILLPAEDVFELIPPEKTTNNEMNENNNPNISFPLQSEGGAQQLLFNNVTNCHFYFNTNSS